MKETREQIIENLRDDEKYYGEYGQQWLSNSDLKKLIENPKEFRAGVTQTTPALLQGGYFHTAILEPEKLGNYAVCDVKTRNNREYRELDKPALLTGEVENINKMIEVLFDVEELRSLIRDGNVEYEVPNIGEIQGHMFKGKADILNHDRKLIIDLKTTADILKFKRNSYYYSYDSQAYIYEQLFGYDMVFVVIDKTSHQVGLYDCTSNFYGSGYEKVERALSVYNKWTAAGFDHRQHFLKGTL